MDQFLINVSLSFYFASASNQQQTRLPMARRTEMRGGAGWKRDQGKGKTTTRVRIPPRLATLYGHSNSRRRGARSSSPLFLPPLLHRQPTTIVFFCGRIVVECDSFLTLAFCGAWTKCDTNVCLVFIFKFTGVKPLVTSLCGVERIRQEAMLLICPDSDRSEKKN